ncbi:glycoside hydrolase family 76 protein [Bacteroides sp. 224]|uniref:glycoside hydrolase family 76 protein n=1 Tax=Bacteroides sp. 224 TaxID=2302936 RepID=UPI0013D5FB9C|nr:glycoside hydrolase family 76 protein [Bacteroides sp. 224]NDV64794.1 alpha-1,6-mannanase [Bacteroides sp. 224]
MTHTIQINSKRTFIIVLLLLTGISMHNTASASSPVNKKKKEKAAQEAATLAIDAFHSTFYNKDFGVYYETTECKKRAAIWTQAMYWDMLTNAYKRTGDAKYLNSLNDFFEGMKRQYANFDWHNEKEWFIYDDIMWWVISLARGYELTENQRYLALSESGFDRVWNGSEKVGDKGSYDPENGGMFWMFKDPAKGKMSCINYPTVIAAMTLYNITEKKEYLNKAKEIYRWSRENVFDLSDGKVADSKHGNGRPAWKTHVYNQATCIGAAVMLYKETGEEFYKQDAILAADYVKNKMSDSKGILFVENGVEQGIYTAIFAEYIIRLIEDCNQKQYLPWMRYNIENGWKNRDARNLTYKDFNKPCPTEVLEVYDASACPALMQVIP